jgi:hypothetical protein
MPATGFFVMPLPRTLMHAVILSATKDLPVYNTTVFNNVSRPVWMTDIWPPSIDDDDDGFIFDVIADAPRPYGRWPLDVDDDEYSNTDTDLPSAPALRPWEHDADHESRGV